MTRAMALTVMVMAGAATSVSAAGPRGGDRAVPRHPGGGYGGAHHGHPRPGYGAYHGYGHGYGYRPVYPYYPYFPGYGGWYGAPGWAFGLGFYFGAGYGLAPYGYAPAVFLAEAAPAIAYARPAANAELRLVVTPEDASVWVDGRFRGAAHRIGRLSLAPGRHRLEFARPGFRDAAREVLADEGTADVLRIELDRS